MSEEETPWYDSLFEEAEDLVSETIPNAGNKVMEVFHGGGKEGVHPSVETWIETDWEIIDGDSDSVPSNWEADSDLTYYYQDDPNSEGDIIVMNEYEFEAHKWGIQIDVLKDEKEDIESKILVYEAEIASIEADFSANSVLFSDKSEEYDRYFMKKKFAHKRVQTARSSGLFKANGSMMNYYKAEASRAGKATPSEPDASIVYKGNYADIDDDSGKIKHYLDARDLITTYKSRITTIKTNELDPVNSWISWTKSQLNTAERNLEKYNS